MRKKPPLDEYGKEIPGVFVKNNDPPRIRNDGWLATTLLFVFLSLISFCVLSLLSFGASYILNTMFDTEIFTFWRMLVVIVLIRFIVALK